MRFRRTLFVLLGAAAMLAIAVPAAFATPAKAKRATATIANAPAFNPADLSQNAAADWPTVGGSYNQTRYSTLNQINTGNVSQLKAAWHVHLDKSATLSKYKGEATPIVYGGTMYVVTGNDDVFAFDAATGDRLWKHSSNIEQNISTICCGWDARGVAIGDGKVYVAQLDGRLVALDQQTGGLVWAATNMRWQEGYTMTSAPLYYNGLVIVGCSGAEFGARCSVTAYDARDGHRVWRFYTVPTPGDIGGGTWPNDNEWQTGGGSVWNTPAADASRNLIYFSTGNADPWSSRGPGDDLFTSSYVALNAMTGDYAAHFQVVHHDIWDYDCPSPILLPTLPNGARALSEACKTGWVYVLNRDTMNPLLEIDEKPVPQNAFNNTSPTQPVPVGDAFANQCTDASMFPAQAPDNQPYKNGCIFASYDDKQYVSVAPGPGGGANETPQSYNPQTNDMYVCSSNGVIAYKAIPNVLGTYQGGKGFIGTQFGTTAPTFQTTGDLTAIDLSNNKIAWKRHFTTPLQQPPNVQLSAGCNNGNMTTAGGLVFNGLPENVGHELDAYDARTGQVLWSFPVDAGIEAPPMTYMVDGTQYVAILVQGTLVPGSGKPHGDSLYTFALNGTIGPGG